MIPYQVKLLLLETLQSSPITATQIKAWTVHDSVLFRFADLILSIEATTGVVLIPTKGKEMSRPGR